MEKKTIHAKAYEPVVQRLKALRKQAGLTIRQLARKLGRDPNLVWRIENRERRIDLLEFVSYCKACGADPVKEVTGLARILAKGGGTGPQKVTKGSGKQRRRRAR